jgi:hypothetical protein
MLHEARNSSGENARLARARAGNDEKRAFVMENCLALSRIEPREWL